MIEVYLRPDGGGRLREQPAIGICRNLPGQALEETPGLFPGFLRGFVPIAQRTNLAEQFLIHVFFWKGFQQLPDRLVLAGGLGHLDFLQLLHGPPFLQVLLGRLDVFLFAGKGLADPLQFPGRLIQPADLDEEVEDLEAPSHALIEGQAGHVF